MSDSHYTQTLSNRGRGGEFRFGEQLITGNFNLLHSIHLFNSIMNFGTEGGSGNNQILRQLLPFGSQRQRQSTPADRLAGGIPDTRSWKA